MMRKFTNNSTKSINEFGYDFLEENIEAFEQLFEESFADEADVDPYEDVDQMLNRIQS